MHPRYEVPRVYRAKVARPPVADRALRALREGIDLDDGRTAPALVRRVRPDVLELTIREGRKRQVRRMCEAVGHPVLALRRVAFGPLALGDLPPGRHRRLTRTEVDALRAASRVPRARDAAAGDPRARRPSAARRPPARAHVGREPGGQGGGGGRAPARGRPARGRGAARRP